MIVTSGRCGSQTRILLISSSTVAPYHSLTSIIVFEWLSRVAELMVNSSPKFEENSSANLQLAKNWVFIISRVLSKALLLNYFDSGRVQRTRKRKRKRMQSKRDGLQR